MADYDLMTGVKKAYEAYSPANKPTAADVGALKQGDFGIGASADQGQIRSWVLPQFSFGDGSIADEYLVLFPSAVAGPHAIKGEIHGSRGGSGSGNSSSIQRINAQSAYNQNSLFSSYESNHRFHYFSIIAIDGMNYVALKGDYTGGYAHNQLVFYGNVIGGDSRLFTRVRASDANVTVVTDNIRSTTMSYHTDNVVGSGGIIERGSNANGEYVKFADGTMICTVTNFTLVNPVAAASRYIEKHITFPAAFIDLNYSSSFVVSGNGANHINWPSWSSDSHGGSAVSNRATGSATCGIYATVNGTTPNYWGVGSEARDCSFIAIGRWK